MIIGPRRGLLSVDIRLRRVLVISTRSVLDGFHKCFRAKNTQDIPPILFGIAVHMVQQVEKSKITNFRQVLSV